jgi:hypothetical protein
MTPISQPIRQGKLFSVVFVILFVLFVYTFLHEAGHAAAGLLYGGTLYSFNFFDFSAHVGIIGAFSAVQRSVINISGVGFPAAAWIFFLLVVPRQANPILELLKTIGSAGLLGSLLPWILIPLVYYSGVAPPGDDVTQFLNNSNVHPLLITAIFSGLFVMGAAFFISRCSLGQILEWLRIPGEEQYTLGTNCTLTAMISIIILLVVMGISMHKFLE